MLAAQVGVPSVGEGSMLLDVIVFRSSQDRMRTEYCALVEGVQHPDVLVGIRDCLMRLQANIMIDYCWLRPVGCVLPLVCVARDYVKIGWFDYLFSPADFAEGAAMMEAVASGKIDLRR